MVFFTIIAHTGSQNSAQCGQTLDGCSNSWLRLNWLTQSPTQYFVGMHAKSIFTAIIAELEVEATNLDAQVTERLYICIFVYTYVYLSVQTSQQGYLYFNVCSSYKLISWHP